MKKLVICIAVVFALFLLPQSVSAAQMLVPGGQVVALELHNDTVTIAAFDETLTTAKNAGLALGDQVTAVGGKPVRRAQDVRSALESANGTVELTVVRNGKTLSFPVTPEQTDSGLRLGIYLRQGVTGIGTLTYYDPQTQQFGALGHGVNDASGSLLSLVDGVIYPAKVLSVRKGLVGKPGQLLGAPDAQSPLGSLTENTAQGVFGKTDASIAGDALPTASPDEIRTGEATIRCTVNGTDIRDYSVEILKIYSKSGRNGRDLLLRVTDPALLETTGGIVQGMSGSPILQNGKLVGAVTHVLVNDPTTGYGIFIENMLDAAA